MKKIILTIVSILGFTLAIGQEFKYGLKAGLNLSNFLGDAEENFIKIGFQVGGFAEIKISNKFAVQTELLYSEQGAKDKFSESFFSYSFKREDVIKLNYLNIPVIAKFYATEKFYIEAGPQIGFLMSVKSNYEEIERYTDSAPSTTVIVSGSNNVENNYKSTDLGFNVGLGYNFTKNIGAGIRYTYGLLNIANNVPSTLNIVTGIRSGGFGFINNTNNSLSAFNNNLAFCLSYKFN